MEGGGLTTVAKQTPARGDTGRAGGVVVSGRGQAHRGHVGAQAGGGGQLDEGDVIVDGAGVPAGVSEHLEVEEDGS